MHNCPCPHHKGTQGVREVQLHTGWVPQLVWTFWRKGKPLAPADIENPDCPACQQSLYWMSYAVAQTSSCVMYMSSCQTTNIVVGKAASLLCIWEVPNSDASANTSNPQWHSSWPSSLYRQMPGQFITVMLQALPSTFVPIHSYLASYQSNKPQINNWT